MKLKYQEFVLNQSHTPIFLKPFWLDFVCGEENWDVSLYEKSNHVKASFVTYNKKKRGLTISSIPRFTQFIGMWVDEETLKQDLYKQASSIHTFQEFFLADLKLPLFFKSALNFRINSFLPFHNNGFGISPRYTYRIEQFRNINFRESIQSSKRRNIKKAEKNGLIFKTDLSPERFYEFHKSVMEGKRATLKYGFSFLKKLMALCKKHECGRSFYIEDQEGKINAAVLVVWDEQDAYHLIPATAGEGADGMTLLIEHILQSLPEHIENYDFEGSMISGVERYYRSLANARRIFYVLSKNPFTKLRSI